MTTENTDNNSDHTRLFETCTDVLQVPEQVQFVASYFNTTTGHATWLLDMYKETNRRTISRVFIQHTDVKVSP